MSVMAVKTVFWGGGDEVGFTVLVHPHRDLVANSGVAHLKRKSIKNKIEIKKIKVYGN